VAFLRAIPRIYKISGRGTDHASVDIAEIYRDCFVFDTHAINNIYKLISLKKININCFVKLIHQRNQTFSNLV